MTFKPLFRASLLALLHLADPVLAAPLKVMTTTTDLRVLVAEVGGAEVVVESFCKGSQDPHFLEAKPSFMVKASSADLIVAVGLGLEVGWLPNILSGSRNAKVSPGQSGYLEAGALVDVLERPSGATSRDQGDVHAEGNPHVTLDPLRAAKIAKGIAERLAKLDPSHAADYTQRAQRLEDRLVAKSAAWARRVKATKLSKVVTYHKTLNYFLDRYGLKAVTYLEPLPGVPPTAKHIVSVIDAVRTNGVNLVLVENYFDAGPARRLEQDVKGLRLAIVPVAVEGTDSVKTLDELYEHLVASLEGKSS